MASLGMVFEDYPDDVICYVTDPKTGVQRRHKFPPAISEIVEALDAQMAHLARMERYKNWGNNEPALIEPPRENRLTLEQLKEKYGENWGLTSLNKTERAHEKPAPSWDKITEMYQGDPSMIARLVGEDQ